MTCHSSNCFSIVWGQGNEPLVTSPFWKEDHTNQHLKAHLALAENKKKKIKWISSIYSQSAVQSKSTKWVKNMTETNVLTWNITRDQECQPAGGKPVLLLCSLTRTTWVSGQGGAWTSGLRIAHPATHTSFKYPHPPLLVQKEFCHLSILLCLLSQLAQNRGSPRPRG